MGWVHIDVVGTASGVIKLLKPCRKAARVGSPRGEGESSAQGLPHMCHCPCSSRTNKPASYILLTCVLLGWSAAFAQRDAWLDGCQRLNGDAGADGRCERG